MKKNELVRSMDFSAAIWAGLISGSAMFLMYLYVLPYFEDGNSQIYLKLIASPLLGSSILSDSSVKSVGMVWLTALVVNFSAAILFSLLLAALVHRWGIVFATLIGSIFGLCVYAINFYSLSYFFPWMFGMSGWPVMWMHIVFGALSGLVYELLEEDELRFVGEK